MRYDFHTCRRYSNENQTRKVLLSMPFSVMAGLVPAIQVVWLARSYNCIHADVILSKRLGDRVPGYGVTVTVY
jgi:hypothetical protein